MERIYPGSKNYYRVKLLARMERDSTPEPNTGCLLWTRKTSDFGYGRTKIMVKGAVKLMTVSRLSWILHKGPIPHGMNVLHKCDTPACFEITHLFLGTHKDNAQDCVKKGRHGHGIIGPPKLYKTHCPQGHEFTPQNTYLYRGKYKVCKKCNNEDSKRRHALNSERDNAKARKRWAEKYQQGELEAFL